MLSHNGSLFEKFQKIENGFWTPLTTSHRGEELPLFLCHLEKNGKDFSPDI